MSPVPPSFEYFACHTHVLISGRQNNFEMPATDSVPGDHRKRRRNRTTQSCLNCHATKRMCDRQRPCSRCSQLGLTSICVYQVNARIPSRVSSRVSEQSGALQFVAEDGDQTNLLNWDPSKFSHSSSSPVCSPWPQVALISSPQLPLDQARGLSPVAYSCTRDDASYGSLAALLSQIKTTSAVLSRSLSQHNAHSLHLREEMDRFIRVLETFVGNGLGFAPSAREAAVCRAPDQTRMSVLDENGLPSLDTSFMSWQGRSWRKSS
ncbi:unnamed protein product [Mycena citricolor]|uniref:Zn(2)-C6 fungal-type domain-containing protein n=1 Tax=Mycena citricolor TaxID=2018698 RepID=A0AAD2Q6I7_9AGAR|nr:unnamed protein product [Mycena citricolor]